MTGRWWESEGAGEEASVDGGTGGEVAVWACRVSGGASLDAGPLRVHGVLRRLSW